MIKYLLTALLIFLLSFPAFSQIVQGGVSENGQWYSTSGSKHQIIDSQTNSPVSNAKITLPKQKYTTYTDSQGTFNLNTNLSDSSVLSVEKQGYRPFSVTVNERIASHPIVIGIEKSNVNDIILSTEMIHLGDDSFSSASANSGEFQGKASGAFYSKMFIMPYNALSKKNYLVIGSIIGIDSLMARNMKQNTIVNSYSSPPEVYLNGSKIAEIQLNGDGQRIRLPNNLIKTGTNEVTLKTGRNMQRTDYIDYDDIEFMNLSILTE